MKNNRDVYVDVAKGLAMLLVVRIHTEVFSVMNVPYPIIAVPLFFFLSGFYDNTDKPLMSWLPKTFKRLFLVGVIWVILSFAYLAILDYAKDKTFKINFSIEDPLIGGGVTWFLFALFYAKILMWIIHKLNIPQWLILTILVLAGGWISKTNLPFLIDEGIGALPFYYAGCVFYPLITNNGKLINWMAIIGCLCLLMMPMEWFPWVFVSYTNSSAFLYPLFFIMTLSSFFSVIWISKKISHWTWLGEFGKQTLGILVIHPLLLHTCAIILNRVLVKGSTTWIIIFLCLYVITCAVSYFCSKWISKNIPFLLGVNSPRQQKV